MWSSCSGTVLGPWRKISTIIGKSARCAFAVDLMGEGTASERVPMKFTMPGKTYGLVTAFLRSGNAYREGCNERRQSQRRLDRDYRTIARRTHGVICEIKRNHIERPGLGLPPLQPSSSSRKPQRDDAPMTVENVSPKQRVKLPPFNAFRFYDSLPNYLLLEERALLMAEAEAYPAIAIDYAYELRHPALDQPLWVGNSVGYPEAPLGTPDHCRDFEMEGRYISLLSHEPPAAPPAPAPPTPA